MLRKRPSSIFIGAPAVLALILTLEKYRHTDYLGRLGRLVRPRPAVALQQCGGLQRLSGRPGRRRERVCLRLPCTIADGLCLQLSPAGVNRLHLRSMRPARTTGLPKRATEIYPRLRQHPQLHRVRVRDRRATAARRGLPGRKRNQPPVPLCGRLRPGRPHSLHNLYIPVLALRLLQL
jgi:hypothetical protein